MARLRETMEPNKKIVNAIIKATSCHGLVAKLLVNRGIRTPEEAMSFLGYNIDNLKNMIALIENNHFKDSDKAVSRILLAIKNKEKILVFGDYDADGVTATACMMLYLKSLEANVSYYLPLRKEGYSLPALFIKNEAVPNKYNLIITVDCGSTSQEAISLAHSHGIDIIVTDHHEVPKAPEDAFAVINPKLEKGKIFEHLAGVGVALSLILALDVKTKVSTSKVINQIYEIVAVGTIADVVPLIKYNRGLVKIGLSSLDSNPTNIGLEYLIKQSGVKKPITSEDIAFQIGPRINSAGRIESAYHACDLLLATEEKEAKRLAKKLCELNDRRKEEEETMFNSIVSLLESDPSRLEKHVLVISGESWNAGLVGIVASKITKKYNKPCIVMSANYSEAIGSARSTETINIYKAISECSSSLKRFGGHKMAAGLSLERDNLLEFTNKIENTIEIMSEGIDTEPKLKIDSELSIKDLSFDLINEINKLEPFGQNNPPPLFIDYDVEVIGGEILKKKHQKMLVKSKSGGRGIPAIRFFNNDIIPKAFKTLVYRPSINYWKGKKQIQIMIEEGEVKQCMI